MKNFRANINISFQLSDEKTNIFVKSIFVSLKPDIDILEMPPVEIFSFYHSKNLYFSVNTNGSDLSNFRSILNSYLRLVQTTSCCLIDSFEI